MHGYTIIIVRYNNSTLLSRPQRLSSSVLFQSKDGATFFSPENPSPAPPDFFCCMTQKQQHQHIPAAAATLAASGPLLWSESALKIMFLLIFVCFSSYFLNGWDWRAVLGGQLRVWIIKTHHSMPACAAARHSKPQCSTASSLSTLRVQAGTVLCTQQGRRRESEHGLLIGLSSFKSSTKFGELTPTHSCATQGGWWWGGCFVWYNIWVRFHFFGTKHTFWRRIWVNTVLFDLDPCHQISGIVGFQLYETSFEPKNCQGRFLDVPAVCKLFY